MSKETRDVAEKIVNAIAVGAWQFQSPGWVIEAIDKALRDRDERAAKTAERFAGMKIEAAYTMGYRDSNSGAETDFSRGGRDRATQIATAIRNGVADAK